MTEELNGTRLSDNDERRIQERRQLLLDDESVKLRTLNYREDVREGVRWMAGFIRRRCNSKLQLLADTVKSVGFKVEESNLAKVLKGYLYLDPQNRPLEHPVLNEDKLIRLIEALKREEKRLAKHGVVNFVETSDYVSFRDKIEEVRADGAVAKFALIHGATGRCKTESAKQLARDDGYLTIHHVECPARPHRKEFLQRILNCFTDRANGNTVQLFNQARETIKNTHCLILDNFQRMYRETEGWNQEIWSDVQILQEDTGCAIAMVVTWEFAEKMRSAMSRGYLEQFTGRCGGEHEFLAVPEFLSVEDAALIGGAFKLEDAEIHADELARIAQRPGRDRVLFRALQKAQLRASYRAQPLTIDLVREVLAPKARLVETPVLEKVAA